jgi:cell division septum initiation protein DivIVA
VRGKKQPEGPRQLGRSAAERLGEIVEAAERAAASVIDDAEVEARRYLAEAS